MEKNNIFKVKKKEYPRLPKEYLYNLYPIQCLGDCDTGKTTLSMWIAQQCTFFDKKYTIGYPEELPGFVNCCNIQELRRESRAVIVIDEIDEIIDIQSKKSNTGLKRLLKYAAHRQFKLIFHLSPRKFLPSTK